MCETGISICEMYKLMLDGYDQLTYILTIELRIYDEKNKTRCSTVCVDSGLPGWHFDGGHLHVVVVTTGVSLHSLLSTTVSCKNKDDPKKQQCG